VWYTCYRKVNCLPSYNYSAKTVKGEVVKGRFDASDKNMVIALLRSKNYYPIEIEEITLAQKEVRIESIKKVTIKDLAILCRQFYTMVDAGLSVLGCLDLLRKQTENKRLAGVLAKIYDEVQKGRSLSEAMELYSNVFPVIMTSLIRVGEVSGSLDYSLERLASHFEKENRTRQKIKTAMTYPAVIGIIALFMVVGMLTFIVPNFVSMFASFGSELPTPTKILIKISEIVKSVYFLLGAPVAIIALTFLFKKFKQTKKGKLIIDTILVRLPLVGVNIKKILASRFTRTLSSLLKTGVPLIQALEVTDKVVDNQIVSIGLEKVMEEVKRGSNLAGPLGLIELFPPMVTQMVHIGEEAGSLDSIMAKVADFYDDEVEYSIGRLISIIEPVMMLVLAVLIGSMVVAMIMPIFSMYQNIR
jgi:type IV pilus assembly protein PilC